MVTRRTKGTPDSKLQPLERNYKDDGEADAQQRAPVTHCSF